jgi:hypothetical protein
MDYSIEQVAAAVKKLRETSPVWEMFKKGTEMDSL